MRVRDADGHDDDGEVCDDDGHEDDDHDEDGLIQILCPQEVDCFTPRPPLPLL